MMSTFNRANCRAIMSFSRLPSRVPAACSPSRRVVSNTATFSSIAVVIHYSAARGGRRARRYCGADLQVCAGPPGPALRATESAISEHEEADVDVGRRTGVLPHDGTRAFPATSPATRAGDSSHFSREWRQARLRVFLAGQGAGWEWSARPPARIPTV